MKYSIFFIVAMVAVLNFDSTDSKPYLFPFYSINYSKQLVVPRIQLPAIRFTPIPIQFSYFRIPLVYPVYAPAVTTVDKVTTIGVDQPAKTKTVVKTKSVSTITSDPVKDDVSVEE